MTVSALPIPTSPADRVLRLSDGARVVVRAAPTGLVDRRTAALAGQLYVIAGHVDTADGHLGGYLGQSRDLDGARSGRSLRRWVLDQRRIHPVAMAVVRPTRPYPHDFRLFLEARTLMSMSGSGYWMLNSQYAAVTVSRRLSRRQVLAGQALAAELASILAAELFNGRRNTYPCPSGSIREAAVKVVLHADRALNTTEVCDGLRALGVTSEGVTWAYTIRRDLNLRERGTRGTPRIASARYEGTRVYWNPATRSKRDALRGYDRAHLV